MSTVQRGGNMGEGQLSETRAGQKFVGADAERCGKVRGVRDFIQWYTSAMLNRW